MCDITFMYKTIYFMDVGCGTVCFDLCIYLYIGTWEMSIIGTTHSYNMWWIYENTFKAILDGLIYLFLLDSNKVKILTKVENFLFLFKKKKIEMIKWLKSQRKHNFE